MPLQNGIDGLKLPWIIIQNWNWTWWVPCDYQASLLHMIFTGPLTIWDTQGSNEWLGSQLRRNERDTTFISNSKRRFPAVIGALIDLKQKPNHFIEFYFQVPQKLHGHWNFRPYWLLAWWDFLFSHGVKVVKNLRGLFSESLKLTVHLFPIILRCSLGLHTPKSGVTLVFFIFSTISIHLQNA